jgi:NAD(P)-dependent dehydrogenase (short-subunit alcohol dehydrogenase family)
MTDTSTQPGTRERTALITGATAGIGYETARVLAKRGAQVLITGRDADRGERAAAAIRRHSGNEHVTFLQADHSTVGGNEELATRVSEALPGLDVLVNNVGGSYATRWETADGYEATLAMNLVGPFALTRELLPLLRAYSPSRVINVSSAAFQMWKRDPFEDVQSREHFVGAEAYAQTKLLNLLFTLALARRLAPEQVTANTLHPGLSWTEMTQSMTPETMPFAKPLWPVLRLMQRLGSPTKAGRRVAFLAFSSDVGAHTGQYFAGKPKPKRLSARELDPENQERAWRLAAELVAGASTSRRRVGDLREAVSV